MSTNAPVGDAYACVAARLELAVNFGTEAHYSISLMCSLVRRLLLQVRNESHGFLIPEPPRQAKPTVMVKVNAKVT